MKAYLILDDGTVFAGESIGADREVISEIVFHTSMTGYLEALTDPSSAGQAVVMTYPLIGNYGICYEDMMSTNVWADGLIVRELSRMPSNFRSEDTIQNFLLQNNIPGIADIDTRALTKLLRKKGTITGMITTKAIDNPTEVQNKLKAHRFTGGVEKVTCAEKFKLTCESPLYKTALIDLGAKKDIAEVLCGMGCDVTVYPASVTADEIMNDKPDGIILSNGPGDPKECISIIETSKKLQSTGIPIFAIGLGHQLVALANGMDTYKMKYGHRGVNQPVKDMQTGKVYISAQNHGYVVDCKTIDPNVAKISFKNVNDETVEGLSYQHNNIDTVQFYPDGFQSPQNTSYLFSSFLSKMDVYRKEKTNA